MTTHDPIRRDGPSTTRRRDVIRRLGCTATTLLLTAACTTPGVELDSGPSRRRVPTPSVARLRTGSLDGPIARLLGPDALTLAPCLRPPLRAPDGILDGPRPRQLRLLAGWIERARGRRVPDETTPAADTGPPLTALELLARAAALLTRTVRAPAAQPDVVDADRLMVLAQLAGGLVDPDDRTVSTALTDAAPRDPKRTARSVAALRRLCTNLGHAPTNADLDAAESPPAP